MKKIQKNKLENIFGGQENCFFTGVSLAAHAGLGLNTFGLGWIAGYFLIGDDVAGCLD